MGIGTKIDKASLGWAFYDWASSAYSLIVLAGFYPILYATYWNSNLSPAEEAFRYGVTVSIASLIAAILSPFLGAIADLLGGKKRLLLYFCTFGILSTISLALIGKGLLLWASLLYILGTVGYYGAYIAYNALLISVAGEGNRHFVSGLGFSLGYFGGVLIFIGAIGFIDFHAYFGIENKAVAVRLSFIGAGIWWTLFTLPLIFWVKEDSPFCEVPLSLKSSIPASFGVIRATCSKIFQIKPIFWFILAYWLYIDGVNTVITMATNYGKILGFKTQTLLETLVLVQIVGVPCTLLFGWLGQRYGPRPFILVGIIAYLGVVVYGTFIDTQPVVFWGHSFSKFFILGLFVGMVQGGLQSLSRSYYASLVPPEHAAAFFGLYNMIGRYAALAGPLLIGLVSDYTGNIRIGIGSTALLFLFGLVFFLISMKSPRRDKRDGNK